MQMTLSQDGGAAELQTVEFKTMLSIRGLGVITPTTHCNPNEDLHGGRWG